MWQLRFGDVGHSLEVVMTSITEVGGAKTEEDGHRATVATLVLQEVCAVLGTHLKPKNVCDFLVKKVL